MILSILDKYFGIGEFMNIDDIDNQK
ncbi:hypothetical protein EVA_11678, partial [gut metagenome]